MAIMEIKETKEITEEVTHKVVTVKALKCDCCGKKFKGKFWKLTTHHYDWGNDSVDSYYNMDLCSPTCVRKQLKEYFEECENSTTQCFELEQEFFKEHRK